MWFRTESAFTISTEARVVASGSAVGSFSRWIGQVLFAVARSVPSAGPSGIARIACCEFSSTFGRPLGSKA